VPSKDSRGQAGDTVQSGRNAHTEHGRLGLRQTDYHRPAVAPRVRLPAATPVTSRQLATGEARPGKEKKADPLCAL
jgi:hypothetical protein